MSESFVDLSYRGLALGKRIKLTQVRPHTGYLEMATPMPVGTTIGIATDDGVLLEAVVAEVREQTGGSELPPGMLIKPNLGVEAQDRWWRSRLEVAREQDVGKDKAPPPADADGKVTLVSPRMSGESAVPELMDDGRDTGVMDAVPGADLVADPPGSLVADLPLASAPSSERGPRDTIVVPMGQPMEEGARTMAMDAVDLAALGLSPPAEAVPAVKAEDYRDNSGPVPEKPDGGKPKRKRTKRR